MTDQQIKRVRIIGDGQFTKVIDVETGKEIPCVQRVEFEQFMHNNGVRSRPLVKLTTVALLESVDIVADTPDTSEEDAKSAAEFTEQMAAIEADHSAKQEG